MSDRQLHAFALPPDLFLQQHGAKLSETFRCVDQHGEHRDSIGNRQSHFRLLRHQGPLERVGLMREIRPPQTHYEVEDAVVGDVESAETHQSTSYDTKSDGGSGFLSPRALRGLEYRLPTIQSPSSKVFEKPRVDRNVVPTATEPKTCFGEPVADSTARSDEAATPCVWHWLKRA